MKTSHLVVLILGATLLLPTSRAQSFVALWENARANEPTLQASRASLTAATERTTQAKAALRPQLSATYSQNQNVRDYQQTQPKSDTQQQFESTTSAINLTQPVQVGTPGVRQKRVSAKHCTNSLAPSKNLLQNF
jgi:outer membrane protein TolC